MKKLKIIGIGLMLVLVGCGQNVVEQEEEKKVIKTENEENFVDLGGGFYMDENKAYFDTIDYGIIESSNIDIKSFKNLGGGFNADKNNIYCFFDEIKITNKETFEVLEKDVFAKDKNNHYRCYLGTSEGVVGQILKIPDPKSFKKLNNEYSKDDFNIFHGDKTKYGFSVLKGADVKSFVDLEFGFAKDKNTIYYDGGYYGGIIKDGDPKSFEVLNESLAIDKNTLYRCVLGCSKKDIDSATFELIDEQGNFAKDKDKVLFMFSSIKEIDIDPNSFEFLDYAFLKDKNNIYITYSEGVKIFKNVDYNTFKSLKNGYAKDKNNCYKKDMYGDSEIVSMSECEKIEKENQ